MYVQEIKTWTWTDKNTVLHTKCHLIARNVGGRLEKLQHEDFEKVQLVW